jgi:hypothetical protein
VLTVRVLWQNSNLCRLVVVSATKMSVWDFDIWLRGRNNQAFASRISLLET